MKVLESRRSGGPRAANSAAPARVLVIEDDIDTASGVRVRLGFEGYEVYHVGDGQNAVSLVQKLAPDVVLLDLGLPGIDGFEVLQRLRVLRPALPVIVVSAWEEQRYEARCIDRGAVMFLQKPIAGEQLAAAVRSVVDRDVD
ncbi:MAG: response regulator transcription factor [Planctomycetota bacterium]